MDIQIKINIVNKNGESYMGKGVIRLLECIRESQSINQAAKKMDMSYMKALKLLNKLEENLDQKILTRTRGGYKRGGAHITPFGNKYIAEYIKLEHRIFQHANAEFSIFYQHVKRTSGNE